MGHLYRFFFIDLPVFAGKGPQAIKVIGEDQAVVGLPLTVFFESSRDGQPTFGIEIMF